MTTEPAAITEPTATTGPTATAGPSRRRGIERDHESRAWIRNLGTAVVIGSLGIALAGAMTTAGTANSTNADTPSPNVQVSIDSQVRQPVEFSHRQEGSSRDAERGALTDRTSRQATWGQQISDAQLLAAQKSRSKELGAAAAAARENGERLSSRIPSEFPLTHYTLTGRWGAIGPWARYHTGVDLAAPLGSTIVAPAPGTVEHAGSGGKAGSWAGCYVVIRHNDGQASLYAHMSCALSVSVGQSVAAGTQLGHVGMTGNTFGPHLHLELYPAGAVPGDIYRSVNPLPWLHQGE